MMSSLLPELARDLSNPLSCNGFLAEQDGRLSLQFDKITLQEKGNSFGHARADTAADRKPSASRGVDASNVRRALDAAHPTMQHRFDPPNSWP
jgi:hypothetical protein